MAILLQSQLLKVRVSAAWTRDKFSWELVHQLDGEVDLRPGQRQDAEEEPQTPVGEQHISLRLDLPAVLSLVSLQTGWSFYCFVSLWWSSQHLRIQSTEAMDRVQKKTLFYSLLQLVGVPSLFGSKKCIGDPVRWGPVFISLLTSMNCRNLVNSRALKCQNIQNLTSRASSFCRVRLLLCVLSKREKGGF